MKKIVLFLSLAVFVFLAACGSTPTIPVQPDTEKIVGSLQNWQLGAGIVEAVFNTKSKQAIVAAGNIASSGSFTATINQTIAPAVLLDMAACTQSHASDSSAKMNQYSTLEVKQNNKLIGSLVYASSETVAKDGLEKVGDFFVQYTYTDKAVNLSGDCPIGGTNASFHYDAKLKKGWNIVIFKLAEIDNNGLQVLDFSTEDVPPSAEWFFVE